MIKSSNHFTKFRYLRLRTHLKYQITMRYDTRTTATRLERLKPLKFSAHEACTIDLQPKLDSSIRIELINSIFLKNRKHLLTDVMKRDKYSKDTKSKTE